MATQRQKKVAKLIVENITSPNPLNGGQIVEKSGYAPVVTKNPHQVLESEGVKSELAILGFTPEAAKTVVSKILNDDAVEPNARLKAADMTFKVHGTYAPEKSVTVSVDIGIDDEDLSLAKQLLEQRTQSIRPAGKGSSPSSDGAVSEPVGREV